MRWIAALAATAAVIALATAPARALPQPGPKTYGKLAPHPGPKTYSVGPGASRAQ